VHGYRLVCIPENEVGERMGEVCENAGIGGVCFNMYTNTRRGRNMGHGGSAAGSVPCVRMVAG